MDYNRDSVPVSRRKFENTYQTSKSEAYVKVKVPSQFDMLFQLTYNSI